MHVYSLNINFVGGFKCFLYVYNLNINFVAGFRYIFVSIVSITVLLLVSAVSLSLQLKAQAAMLSAVSCAAVPKITVIVGNGLGYTHYVMVSVQTFI